VNTSDNEISWPFALAQSNKASISASVSVAKRLIATT
jgi:hypothetical protein